MLKTMKKRLCQVYLQLGRGAIEYDANDRIQRKENKSIELPLFLPR